MMRPTARRETYLICRTSQ